MKKNLKRTLAVIAIILVVYMLWNQLQNLSYMIANNIMNKTPLAVYYVTTSNKQEAEKIATALLERKLAACCNIVEGVTSVYTWQNKINTDP